jgi:hypothetical protein
MIRFLDIGSLTTRIRPVSCQTRRPKDRYSALAATGGTQIAEECVIKSTLGSSDFTFTLTDFPFGRRHSLRT